jgi:hypothetical protein
MTLKLCEFVQKDCKDGFVENYYQKHGNICEGNGSPILILKNSAFFVVLKLSYCMGEMQGFLLQDEENDDENGGNCQHT